MTSLANLEALARRIAQAESAGNHDSAAMFWELLDDEVAQMPVEQLRNAVKQLLIARSDSSVTLATGPRGAFTGPVSVPPASDTAAAPARAER